MTETNPFPRLLLVDLPSRWSEDDIYPWFIEYGDILSISITRDRLVSMAVIIYAQVASAIKAMNGINGQYAAGNIIRLHWVAPYSLNQIHPSPYAPHGRPPIVQVLLSYITSQMQEIIDEKRLIELVTPIGLPKSISIQKHKINQDRTSQSGYAFVYFYQTWAGLNAAAKTIVWFKKRSIAGIIFDAKFGEQYERYLQRNLLMPADLSLHDASIIITKMPPAVPPATPQFAISTPYDYFGAATADAHHHYSYHKPPLAARQASSSIAAATAITDYSMNNIEDNNSTSMMMMRYNEQVNRGEERNRSNSSHNDSSSFHNSHLSNTATTASIAPTSYYDPYSRAINTAAVKRLPISNRNYSAPLMMTIAPTAPPPIATTMTIAGSQAASMMSTSYSSSASVFDDHHYSPRGPNQQATDDYYFRKEG